MKIRFQMMVSFEHKYERHDILIRSSNKQPDKKKIKYVYCNNGFQRKYQIILIFGPIYSVIHDFELLVSFGTL